MISITHLEPCSKDEDPYGRPQPDHLSLVLVEGDTKEWQSFKIDKIVNKQQIKYEKGKPITEYRIKWKGYGLEWNEWYPENLLDNAKDLIWNYYKKHS